jgi:palmitoyltransferase ZDHHC2/15/20
MNKDDLRIINYIFPIIIFVLLIYSYYAYIIEICLNKFVYVDRNYDYVYGIFCFYHVNYILILWSFLKIMIESDIKIPEKYNISEKFIESFEKLASNQNLESESNTTNSQLISDIDDPMVSIRYNFNKNQKEYLEIYCKKKDLILLTRTEKGNINICLDCKIIKPDRCHHCRKCNKCILRMDHHCPYLNRCIGYTNQKYFLLFLIYVSIYITFLIVTIMNSFIESWNYKFYNEHTEFHIFVLSIGCICIILPISSLMIYSLRLTFLNRTSLEEEVLSLAVGSKNLFDTGNWKTNFQQIFGKNFILAFLPVWTTIDNGYDYKRNTELPSSSIDDKISLI